MPTDDLPRSPTGRVPQWVVDEAASRRAGEEARGGDGPAPGRARDGAAASGADDPPDGRGRFVSFTDDPRPPAARPRSLRRPLLVVVPVVAAMVGVGALTAPRLGDADLMATVATVTGGDAALPPASERRFPAPGVDESGARLAEPVAGTGSTAFAFAEHQSMPVTGPVTWSPCRPVHYVVNPSGAPPDFAERVRAVADEVAAATGLVLVDDGTTTEPAAADRASFQPELYGDRWAPVLVRVADAAGVPALEGDVAGAAVAASATDPRSGVRHYVSGLVVLDAQVLQNAPTPAGDPDYLSVLRHELAHLMGLAHVDDPTQLMYPVRQASAEGTFAAGDLAGLAALGKGRCAPGL